MRDRQEDSQRLRLSPRLRAQIGLKVGVWLGLAAGICIPYFSLQRLALLPPHSPPLTPLDQAIPFAPEWIWAYVSIALLVPLGPLMATQREDLRRYSRGLAVLCLVCFATFVLVPVLGPRPADSGSIGGLYSLIVGVDRPSNSLPSLHAGLTLYTMLFGWRVLAPALTSRGRALLGLGAVTWTALILYSTLATRQHWAVDLPAGMMIAYGAHLLAWRGVGRGRESERVALSAG